MVSKKLTKALFKKKNKVYLRRLFNLPQGTSKGNRLKVLRKGTKEQRQLLIHVLHHVLSGQIPMRGKDFPLIARKMNFLNSHFQTEDAVRALLSSADSAQKEVLGQVTNFHVLLYSLFKN
jgi:hypothetical protein